MHEKVEFEGKDLEDALSAAAQQLGLPTADLHYEVIEPGRRGVLGLGVRNVRIRVVDPLVAGTAGVMAPLEHEDEDDLHEEGDPPPADPAGEVSDEVAVAIGSTAQRMLDLSGLELSVRAAPSRGGVAVEVEGADAELLLERDGELVAALQLLLNRMARRLWPAARQIHVSCAGQMGSVGRDDEIVRVAREAAQQVARTGRTCKLHPLNSYERRLVHLTVREFPGLTSSSDGQGARKRVRISKVRNTVA